MKKKTILSSLAILSALAAGGAYVYKKFMKPEPKALPSGKNESSAEKSESKEGAGQIAKTDHTED